MTRMVGSIPIGPIVAVADAKGRPQTGLSRSEPCHRACCQFIFGFLSFVRLATHM